MPSTTTKAISTSRVVSLPVEDRSTPSSRSVLFCRSVDIWKYKTFPIKIKNDNAQISDLDIARRIVSDTSLLKVFSAELSVTIDHDANFSFAASLFPSWMKLGQVKPLLKKQGMGAGNFKSFRPVTKHDATISKNI